MKKKAKLFSIIGIVFIAILCLKRVWCKFEVVVEDRAKYRSYFRLLNKWMEIKERKASLETYFIENHFEIIAIYGMGIMGKHLFEELKDSNVVKIVYAIDKKSGSIESPVEVRNVSDVLPEVDAVIVTAIQEFDNIREMLSEKLRYPIISLEEVID